MTTEIELTPAQLMARSAKWREEFAAWWKANRALLLRANWPLNQQPVEDRHWQAFVDIKRL